MVVMLMPCSWDACRPQHHLVGIILAGVPHAMLQRHLPRRSLAACHSELLLPDLSHDRVAAR